MAAAVFPRLVAVVGEALRHQIRPQIRVSQSQRPEVMTDLLDLFGGIAGVVDDDLLSQDQDRYGMAERLGVELSVRLQELHQVQRGQIAGRVVEEDVLGAGVASVDGAGVGTGVPLIESGLELQAGIAALQAASAIHCIMSAAL